MPLYNQKIEYYIKRFQCEEFLDRPIRKLSLGQKIKVEIIAVLFRESKLLIMDEPFIGLDYLSKRVIIDELDKVIKEKTFHYYLYLMI